jgi:hypothetical protein
MRWPGSVEKGGADLTEADVGGALLDHRLRRWWRTEEEDGVDLNRGGGGARERGEGKGMARVWIETLEERCSLVGFVFPLTNEGRWMM